MSVRSGLLAILGQGPMHGYGLTEEFGLRTGGMWTLNSGQIYSTLARLERDGAVTSSSTGNRGRIVFDLTEAGAAEACSWLLNPVVNQAKRDELTIKLAIAATLSDIDIAEVIRIQRFSTLSRLQTLSQMKADAAPPSNATELASSLVLESALFQAEAEVHWLDYARVATNNSVRSPIVSVVAIAAQ